MKSGNNTENTYNDKKEIFTRSGTVDRTAVYLYCCKSCVVRIVGNSFIFKTIGTNVMNQEQDHMTQGAESTHIYLGRRFIVDHVNGLYQCVESGMIVKGIGKTKNEAIENAHKD